MATMLRGEVCGWVGRTTALKEKSALWSEARLLPYSGSAGGSCRGETAHSGRVALCSSTAPALEKVNWSPFLETDTSLPPKRGSLLERTAFQYCPAEGAANGSLARSIVPPVPRVKRSRYSPSASANRNAPKPGPRALASQVSRCFGRKAEISRRSRRHSVYKATMGAFAGDDASDQFSLDSRNVSSTCGSGMLLMLAQSRKADRKS